MIGEYNNKVIIQEWQGDTEDDVGGLSGGAWVEIKRSWAKVVPGKVIQGTGGRREFEQGQINDNLPYSIEMSYMQNLVGFGATEGLNKRFRLVLLDGSIITIHSIKNVKQRRKKILITGLAEGVSL